MLKLTFELEARRWFGASMRTKRPSSIYDLERELSLTVAQV